MFRNSSFINALDSLLSWLKARNPIFSFLNGSWSFSYHLQISISCPLGLCYNIFLLHPSMEVLLLVVVLWAISASPFLPFQNPLLTLFPTFPFPLALSGSWYALRRTYFFEFSQILPHLPTFPSPPFKFLCSVTTFSITCILLVTFLSFLLVSWNPFLALYSIFPSSFRLSESANLGQTPRWPNIKPQIKIVWVIPGSF